MSWTELRTVVLENQAEELSHQLTELGAAAVTFEDAGNHPLFEPAPDAPRLWPETTVIALFDDAHSLENAVRFLERQKAKGFIKTFHSIHLKDEDWERRCLDQFEPIQIGKKLWICPSWHLPKEPSAINVLLDPGLAFGTGTHPTTQLCLAWLEEHLKPNWALIDYGCGSGILGIAAYKLGAKHIIAIDNDPQALLASQMNAERNHISAKAFRVQSPEEPVSENANLLIANILAEPLITLAPTFKKLIKRPGYLVLSGILKDQIDHVLSFYAPYFDNYVINFKGEWALLAGLSSKP